MILNKIRSALERNLNLNFKRTTNRESNNNNFVGGNNDLLNPKGKQKDNGPRMSLQYQSVGMVKPRNSFPTRLPPKVFFSRPLI